MPRISIISRRFGVGFALFAATAALYWPVRNHEFVNYDDPDYVTENHYVRAGLTWEGVEWAFTRIHGPRTYWHPLTWLSHMLDCEWFGMNAGAHHLVSVVFHACNALLVFLVFRRLTGTTWRSAAVAALFALHPLQVDTVAWVTERKNLLSTLFFLTTLLAYAKHARDYKYQTAVDGSVLASLVAGCRSPFYWFSLALFALGLMCKPAVVILPCVLLLLDYWPLKRLGKRFFLRVVVEKTPFFVLTTASGILTILAHYQLGMVSSGATSPIETRLANAVVSYARYLSKAFWPQDLAVFYPYTGGWAVEQVFGATVVLAGISALVFCLRKSRPYLVLGWCWFLGTLVPTIGLIQVGSQSMADRFAYVPLLGLFVMLVWGCSDLLAGRVRGALASGILATAVLLACALVTHRQLGYWKDSVALFTHTAAVTRNNVVALNNLGTALLDRGELDEAEKQYRASIEAEPNVPFAYYNLGHVLELRGHREEAMAQYRRALQLDPRDATVYFRIADAMARANELDEAIRQYEAALRLDPEHAGAHNNLAVALVRAGRLDAAMDHAREALNLDANNPEVHNNLGNICAERGQHEQALTHYRRAIKVAPGLARAHYNLGNSLLQLGQTNEAKQSFLKAARLDSTYLEPQRKLAELSAGVAAWTEAIQYYSNVVQLDTNQFSGWNNLGGALAELGQFEKARNCFWEALRIKPDFTNAQVNLARITERLGPMTPSPENARAHYALARLLHRQGDRRGAVEHLLAAAEYQPDWMEAANDAAWLLATAPERELRNGSEAVRLAERANTLARQAKPNVLGTLAAAYAEAGRFADAISAAEKAVHLAERAGLQELAKQSRARLELYRAGKAYQEP